MPRPLVPILLATSPDPPAPAFMGGRDCGVTVMTLLPDDGDRIVVQGVTDSRMNRLSRQTGDSFDCTRVAA